jgi:membrane-bound lytic murein transglycosylase D
MESRPAGGQAQEKRMTARIDPAIVVLARLACVSLVLAGCATTPPPSDTLASSNPSPETSLRSLRIADVEHAAKAAAPSDVAQNEFALSPTTAHLQAVEIDPPPAVPDAIDLTRDTDDLLQRIRNGFSMPDINSDLVLYHQQWYMNRPDYMRRVVERSSRYMHYIVEELEKRGMPTELALLPMVESAYNPMALSRSKASGLWQFIPSTGKRYNLDQTWWKDERRDIVASTTAALDYLQSIYEMHGDWHLALASYNWGEGAVGRAINKNRAQDLPTDYLSLNMPSETKNYVPKLQALKNIFSSPALIAELGLPTVPNRPYFSTITQTASIDVNVAARLAEMPVQEFVALNPAHNRPVIMPESPLVIPADKLDIFRSNLEAHEESNKPLSVWQTYTLRVGDKLDRIARRFGMSLAGLKSVNGIKGRTRVKPGTTLLVSGNKGAEPATPAGKPEPVRMAASGSVRTHTVGKGDTLFSIAKRYGVTVAELKRVNRLKSDRLAAGARLALGGEQTAGTNRPDGSEAVAQRASTTITPKIRRYTIRRGDTLVSIARQFNVSTDDLLRWNSVSPRSLMPGQTLTIQVQLAQNS